MLYVIDKKYYIKIGRKFIEVNVTYENDDLKIEAKNNKYIEDNGDIKYDVQVIDDTFKKNFNKSSDKYKSYE